MKEVLKTLMIIILSISSIFLLILNFGIEPGDYFLSQQDPSSSLIFDSDVIMADAVMPEYVGINFGGDNHTVVNNARNGGIWADTQEVLKGIFEEKGETIRSRETISFDLYKNFINQESVILFFNDDITPLTFLNALGIEEPKDFVYNYNHISFIHISLIKNFIVIGEGNRFELITLDFLDTGRLKNSVDNIYLNGYNPYDLGIEVLGSERLIYIPKISEHKIERLAFENILSNLDHEDIGNIIYSFFGKEVNYVREIKEEGKQTIYVDGSKLLKISDRGLISYYDPEMKASPERNLYLSLANALAFISNNLGYDNSLYLKEIQPFEFKENQGFKIIFGKNSRGYKVDLEDEVIVDYIEIDVFNEHILRYAQFFRGEVADTTSYYEIDASQELRPILAANLNYINAGLFENPDEYLNFEDILSLVERANVGYIDKGLDEDLALVWKIKIKGQNFYFEIEKEED